MAVLAELYADLKFIFSYRSKVMKKQLALNKLAPRAGDIAPDFTLWDTSGTNQLPCPISAGRSRLPWYSGALPDRPTSRVPWVSSRSMSSITKIFSSSAFTFARPILSTAGGWDGV